LLPQVGQLLSMLSPPVGASAERAGNQPSRQDDVPRHRREEAAGSGRKRVDRRQRGPENAAASPRLGRRIALNSMNIPGARWTTIR
jgi:hypothetical protein